MIENILRIYGIDPQRSRVELLTSGLINHTWKVAWEGKDYIVQRINEQVFKKPFEVAANIRMIDAYLKEHFPNYLFVSPVANLRGDDIHFEEDNGYFRVFPFIKGSHTINVVSNPRQAFQ